MCSVLVIGLKTDISKQNRVSRWVASEALTDSGAAASRPVILSLLLLLQDISRFTVLFGKNRFMARTESLLIALIWVHTTKRLRNWAVSSEGKQKSVEIFYSMVGCCGYR